MKKDKNAEIPQDSVIIEVEKVQTETNAEPQVQTQVVEQSRKSSKTIWIILAIVLLLLVCCCVGGGILYTIQSNLNDSTRNPFIDISSNNTNSTSTNATSSANTSTTEVITPPKSTTTVLTLNYISATVPNGWTIKEYVNGLGSSMLTEGVNYTGLTGVEIITPNNKVAAKFQGIYGIGGTDSCSVYYQFPDDDPTYYNKVVFANGMTSDPAPTIKQILNYTEVNLLSLKLRRSEASLYQDKYPADDKFEALCGIAAVAYDLTPLNYSIESGFGSPEVSTKYNIVIEPTLTNQELIQLDEILNSLNIVP